MSASFEALTTRVCENATEICKLRARNDTLTTSQMTLQTEVNSLKKELDHVKECNMGILKRIGDDISEVKREINSIEQYLRVNNLEIVGLPEPGNDETEEQLMINTFNALPELGTEITSEDIDISHPLPSNRRDNKKVVVCRFVSRKSKFDILEAKKRLRKFKFRGNEIFINEHLSPINRSVFGLAAEKKRTLDFKHLWTKNGVTYMRKTDRSEIYTINCAEDLDRLAHSPRENETLVSP